MEGDSNLGEGLEGYMPLTDEQFRLLENLPVSTADNSGFPVRFSNQYGLYTKAVYPRITTVNFTRLDARGFGMDQVVLYYVPSSKECRFIDGNFTKLDQFLAEAFLIN